MNERDSLFPLFDLVELDPELDPYAILKRRPLPAKSTPKKAKKTARKKPRKR